MSFEFLQQFEEEEVLALTGLSSSTFQQIYEKYCGPSTPIKRPIYLWWLFQYYKIYPVSRAFRTIHLGALKTRRGFLYRLYRWQVSKSKIIDICDSFRLFSMLIVVFDACVIYRSLAIPCVSYR